MCGIVGFFSKDSFDYIKVLNRMTSSIIHRGPDNTKFYINKESNFYAGFNRLSIIDLTENGMQPMTSFDNKFTILFNGEIYNFRDLKIKLLEKVSRNIKFNSTSDTEILLNCFSIFGIDETLDLIEGQFAIALWDNVEKKLFLIRDRFGEKPLYYGNINNSFVFGSELKSLLKFPNFHNQISKKSLELYFRFLNVPSPRSIYENIYKVEPAEVIKIDFNRDSFIINFEKNLIKRKYWDSTKTLINSKNNETLDYNNSLKLLEEKLRSSIEKQSYADVPLASLLSGGIDSSLISALYQTQSNYKINTFTIGFENQKFNEADFASKISDHLGTNHTQINLNETNSIDLVSRISNIYSEPFADSSQIPTLLVSREISNYYKVALSGDGGDEFFGGYNRYIWINKLWKIINYFPFILRKQIFLVLNNFSEKSLDNIFIFLKNITFNYIDIKFAGQKLKRVSQKLINVKNIDELFMYFISEWTKEDQLLIDHKYDNEIFYNYQKNNTLKIQEKMMLHDTNNYLPNDILVKTDIASMNSSLEIRSPFLDKSVYEHAWKIPLNYKINHNKGKIILAEILKKYIPENIFDRPKQGFSIPLDDWLRTSLFNWSKDIIMSDEIEKSNFLNSKIIRNKWQQHQSGSANWGQSLWTVLVFQQWLREVE